MSQFKIDPGNMKAALRDLDFLVPANELRQNRGFETVTHAHPNGQHEGGLVVVSEKSLDKQGNIFAAIIEGPNKGIFTIKRSGDFDITDGAFLPDGDLLLLERSLHDGGRREDAAAAHLWRGASPRARSPTGRSCLPPTWPTRSTIWKRWMSGSGADGTVMVSLMSDDNHSILQRNLYLEFILHQD